MLMAFQINLLSRRLASDNREVGDEYDATLEYILYDDEQYYWTTDDIDQIVSSLVLKLRAAKLRQRAVQPNCRSTANDVLNF